MRDPSPPPDDTASDGAGTGHARGPRGDAGRATESGYGPPSGAYGRAGGGYGLRGGPSGPPGTGAGNGVGSYPGPPPGDQGNPISPGSVGRYGAAADGRGLGALPAGALSRADQPPGRRLPGSLPDDGPLGPNGGPGPHGPNGPSPGARRNGPGDPGRGSHPGGPGVRPPGDEDEPGRGRHARRERKGKPPRSLTRTIVEWVAVVGGGIVIALVIEAFLIQAFWIPSPSMVPTLNVGDRVLVNKLSYQWGDVHRGDVIVFERPEGVQGDDGVKDLIKRVIAVGGDTIEARNGLVYVNGERVDESDYLEPGTPTDDLPPTEVPEGHVFVMGDNRTNSTDSREFGPIAEDTIVGRAFIKVLPLSDIGWL